MCTFIIKSKPKDFFKFLVFMRKFFIIIFSAIFILLAATPFAVWFTNDMAEENYHEFANDSYEVYHNDSSEICILNVPKEVSKSEAYHNGFCNGWDDGDKDARFRIVYKSSYNDFGYYKATAANDRYRRGYIYGYVSGYEHGSRKLGIRLIREKVNDAGFWDLQILCILIAICGGILSSLLEKKKEPEKSEAAHHEVEKQETQIEEMDSVDEDANEDDEDFDFTEVEILEDYDLACVDLKEDDYEYLATLHPREVIRMLGGYPRRLLGKNDYNYYGQDSYSFDYSHSSTSSSIPNSKNEGWYDNTDYEDPADMYDDDEKY